LNASAPTGVPAAAPRVVASYSGALKASAPTPRTSPVWAGVDVGGRRKGFHVAVVDGRRLVAGPVRLPGPAAVVEWIGPWRPLVVGVDSPCSLAEEGKTMRDCERLFSPRTLCGIRPTPSASTLARQRRKRGAAATYYEWIEHGLELYAALREAKLTAIDVFPTASWTRWLGPRRGESRARWSSRALASRHLRGVPSHLGQDGRDAIGAALTARAYTMKRFEPFGEMVIPLAEHRGGAGRR